MAIVGHFRAGKFSRVQVNGTDLNTTEWSVDDTADDLDTTTFESSGFDQGTIGIESASYSVRGNWDASLNAFDNPPAIYPQDSLGPVKFYENQADNTFWFFPLVRVLSCRNGAQVKGLVTFEWSGKAQGSFSRPTGSN